MPSIDFIKSEYPLHWLVWNNEYKELDKELSQKASNVSVECVSERSYSKVTRAVFTVKKKSILSKCSLYDGRPVIVTR
jgi:hypothetical protein